MNKLIPTLKSWFEKAKSFKITMPKIKLHKVKIPKITLPKIKMPNIKPILNIIFTFLKKAWAVLLKALKGFIVWLWKAIKESIAQVWTLLGFFIAWLTLTGTAQQIVGIATILATIIWLVTIPLREEKDE